VELSCPHIEGNNALRAGGEGHFREATRRRSDIEHTLVNQFDREYLESSEQLYGPARDPPLIVTNHLDMGLGCDQRRRFRRGQSLDLDSALRYQVLGIAAARGQIPSDQLGIETTSDQSGSDSSRIELSRSASSAAGSGSWDGSSSPRRVSAASSFSICSGVRSMC